MSWTDRGAARLLLASIVVAAAMACSDEDSDDEGTSDEVPADVASFVERIAEPGSVPFRATYSVLHKFGGETSTVEVVATPPAWTIRVGEVVVTGGPVPKTCTGDPPTCADGVVESRLTPFGLTSTIFATGTARSLEDAGRNTAADPVFTTRTEAGVELDCMTVELGTLDRTACLTPEGVVGLVDDSARRIVLTSYQAG
jgi:hypothetical protein